MQANFFMSENYGKFCIQDHRNMLTNYLRIAWRNIRKQPVYSTINVLGLAIGICACTVVYLIATFDLGFDRFHPDKDRIYRIVGDIQLPDGSTMFLNCPPQLASLEHGIPGFEQAVGFHTFGFTVTIPGENGQAGQEFSTKPDRRYGTSMILTGAAFFQLFPHRWLLGAPAVLDAPNKLVLSESVARKYFGNGPLDAVMGRTVMVEDSLPLTVAGIVDDWAGLSDLDYTGFISISTAPNSWVRSRFPTADWGSLLPHQSQAFVKLAKGVTAAKVNAALAAYVQKAHPILFPGTSNMHLYLQALTGMHYTPNFHRVDTGDDFPQAYLPLLYALIGVAFFILVLAVINFINLSTAQSLRRTREVGIRKVMGSSRWGLIAQFLVETLLLTGCAVVISVLLVKPALLLFKGYIPYGVEFHPLDGGNILFLLIITVVTTLMAGFYPARLLSSYLPVLSLKGAVDKVGMGGAGLRKGLIVFQFTISLLFIVGSLVITRQVRFMRNADKGFNSDAIVTVNARRIKAQQMQLFAANVRKLAGVREVIPESGAPMSGGYFGGTNYKYQGKKLTCVEQFAGADFIPFYNMRLLAGRSLLPGDSVYEGVINETMMHALGIVKPMDAIGQVLYRDTSRPAYTIVGVVADFHQESFHERIKPLVIRHDASVERSVAIKLATVGKQGDEARTLMANIETEWKKVFAKNPFAYSFLNASIARLYNEENNTAWLMQAAMVITILISCMGLFGLALFTASRRAKEVGIRKVMGATVSQIFLLLSRDFLLLVLVSLVIASPVAWYLAARWLNNFAYREPMSVWVIAEAGLAALALALLTVGFQAVRAARANPIETLRSE
jgi:hypothetical protein